MSLCEGQGLQHPKHVWALGSEATTKNWLQSVARAASSWNKSEQLMPADVAGKHPPVSIKRVYLLNMVPGPDMHPNTLLPLCGLG